MEYLRANDWSMRRFIVLSISLLLFYMCLTFGSEYIDLDIYWLRSISGFIILVFIPGFSVLRAMRLHELGTVRSVMFAIGISLSILMLMGLALNIISPFFGVYKTLAPQFITVITIISLVGLLIVAYTRDKFFVEAFNNKKILPVRINKFVLLSILLLICGIISIEYTNSYDNSLQMMLILIISLIPLIISFKKITDNDAYLLIFSISLIMVYSTTLFTNSVVGTDIFGEYRTAELTGMYQSWDSGDYHILNSAISVTILPQIFYSFCGIDLLTYFKIMVPFIYSIIPVGLYALYTNMFSKIMSGKARMFAVLLIIFTWYFFQLIPGVAREEIGEYFLILLVFVLLERDISNIALSVLFSISIILSHYTIAFVFLMILAGYIIFYYIIKKFLMIYHKENIPPARVGFSYVLLFLVFSFIWYLYISSGAILRGIGLMGQRIIDGISSISEPETNITANIISASSLNFSHDIYRILFYLIIIFLIIGGFKLFIIMLNRKQVKNYYQYIALAFPVYCLLGAYLFVPFIGYGVGLNRILHIALYFLAPCVLFGFNTIIEAIRYIFNIITGKRNMHIEKRESIRLFAIFLCIFFLFNSGFIFQLIKDPYPNSISLSLDFEETPENDNQSMGNMYLKIQTISDIEKRSVEWMNEHIHQNNNIFVTYGSQEFIYSRFDTITNITLLSTESPKGYLYYGYIGKVLGLEVTKIPNQQTIVRKTNTSYIDSNSRSLKIYETPYTSVYRLI
jgi:uncharacterized membrane protein